MVAGGGSNTKGMEAVPFPVPISSVEDFGFDNFKPPAFLIDSVNSVESSWKHFDSSGADGGGSPNVLIENRELESPRRDGCSLR